MIITRPRPEVRALRGAALIAGAAVAVFSALLLGGCSSGGGNSNNNGGGGGGGNPGSTRVAGTVTDANSNPVVGATVTIGGQTAVSSLHGAFVINSVAIPAAQSSVIAPVTATVTVNGRAFSGQNIVELLGSEVNTSNVQIVVSDTASQGRITGVVRDPNNNAIGGVPVFAGVGPFTNTVVTGDQFFVNFGSYRTFTDSNGAFTLPALPPDTAYTVTASFAPSSGQKYTNATMSNVTVTTAQSTFVNLKLGAAGSPTTVPDITNFSALSFTSPSYPSRSAGSKNGTEALVNWELAKKGLLKHRATSEVVLHRSATRATPPGSIIQSVLTWTYNSTYNATFGYEIDLATSLTPANFVDIATLRDPLADRYSDSDSSLTPDTLYYYSVSRIDTVAFPTGTGGFSNPSAVAAVQPLNALTLASPNNGAGTSANPTLSWNSLLGAASYNLFVYDHFPVVQSDTDPLQQPLWSVPVTGTSAVYSGPALTRGQTYYWVVMAQDAPSATASAFSISEVQSFTVQ